MFPREFGRYIEIFGGSGAVLLGKEPSKFEVYNDIEGELVNFFRVVKNRPAELLLELDLLPLNSREEFASWLHFHDGGNEPNIHLPDQLEIIDRTTPSSLTEEAEKLKTSLRKRSDYRDVRQAAAYLMRVRNSYSSSGRSFACQPFSVRTLFTQIWEMSRRLENVIIEQQSFEVLMRPFEGVTSTNNMEMAPIFDYSWLKPVQNKYALVPGIGKMHHFGGDYQIGLDLGWYGLLDKVERYSWENTDEEAQELYAAEKDVLLGIINWVERTIETIAQMEREESDPAVKKNLREMLEANRQILKGPARNLREACQWISWYNMAERTYCRAGAGCQLDCTLLPYYEKSVAEGMTDDEATFILACFLLCDPHYYQIGGPAADGSDNTNHLSYLILEAAHQLKSTANITIRVFDNMDEGLFRRGLEILFEDRLAYPRFSGDKALVSGFMKNGYSAELARRRIALGCNWMSLPGLEYTMNDLVKINMAKVFEVAFQEYQGDDLAEFYDVFRKDLLEAIACIKAGIDFHLKNQYRNAPELLLNLVSHGPIEKGRDASHGGLQYYNIAIDGAGIATVADSFAALELHWCEW